MYHLCASVPVPTCPDHQVDPPYYATSIRPATRVVCGAKTTELIPVESLLCSKPPKSCVAVKGDKRSCFSSVCSLHSTFLPPSSNLPALLGYLSPPTRLPTQPRILTSPLLVLRFLSLGPSFGVHFGGGGSAHSLAHACPCAMLCPLILPFASASLFLFPARCTHLLVPQSTQTNYPSPRLSAALLLCPIQMLVLFTIQHMLFSLCLVHSFLFPILLLFSENYVLAFLGL